ncbi:DUF5799 family protein [Haloarcula onubensis]|uniref:DUF5799 family protein n=1 Tax=Haloarcula onubensis TaxID=2950539 RepID=A0ABU2FVA9_9EURY|nr:DUF5799 family protein [Halomicroarcula sp. S3CR25-11]MDS0284156.1 DUF5799 family protein [Halomicroarcula sp. S3CR25-11]
MSDDWTGRIAGERMAVDRQFSDRVEASSFSNQQWGLVMTAVEFDIENPETPESARLVADTSKLPSIMPELDKVDQGGPMAGGRGGDPRDDAGGGGFLSGVKAALGLAGGDDDDGRAEEAEQLAQAYADELQAELESNGRWERVCEQASN